MKNFDVITIGSALKDTMFCSAEAQVIKNPTNDPLRQKLLAVEYGAKLEVEQVHVNYGGAALNVAVGLKNFNLNVAPLVNIGADAVGQEIISFLKKQKISADLISLDEKAETGFSFIVTAQGKPEHTIFSFKGASRKMFLPAVKYLNTEWFYLSALSAPDWDKKIAKVFDFVKKSKGAQKIIWNPGVKQLKEYKKLLKFLPQLEVLLLNKDEALDLVMDLNGHKVNQEPKYLLAELQNFGIPYVIITDGSNGVFGVDSKGKFSHIPSQAKKIVDTVGAGDSFGSGFLAALIATKNFSKALEYGIKNSAANLAQIGAQTGLLKGKIKS